MTDSKKTIRLVYRPGVMTLNDMCTLERPTSFSEVRDLLARHFVDGAGNYIDDIEAAREAVGNVPRDGIGALISDLRDQAYEYSTRDNDPN